MTDPDSPTPPRSGTSGPTPDATSPRDDAPGPGQGLRDTWWWSPTLALVVGLVVVGYQLPSLRSPEPLWISWVVAGVGAVVALVGLAQLLRAYRSR
ncbi:hypothetical protein [Cellulomonas aerilata]|uniref:Uncharacterized protein n=1 Tax=Cellulomonas aerilata TaxID=515326 RepID=A0A512DAF2_9CELL|nr:hypothetical protein [Cellulomonas aerilata]GEO33462.1 hypothetical protein CAE01nite_11870 [Cellulomonas aerilata]